MFFFRSELSALQSEHKFMLSEKEALMKQLKVSDERTASQVTVLQQKNKVLEDKLQQVIKQNQAIISKMASEGEEMVNSYEVSKTLFGTLFCVCHILINRLLFL